MKVYFVSCIFSSGRGRSAGEQEPGRGLHGVRVAGSIRLPSLPRRDSEHAGSHGQSSTWTTGTGYRVYNKQ